MKNSLFSIIMAGIIVTSCMAPAEKQYFEESADINLGKKVMEAYLAQDWATMAASYADTARIWRNVNWETNDGFTADEYMEDLKGSLENISSYSFENQVYESIITNDGDHWVHFWGVWNGHSEATNKDYEIPVHLSMGIVEGKIAMQGDIFNNTEITMDMMALQMKAEEGEHDDDDDDGM